MKHRCSLLSAGKLRKEKTTKGKIKENGPKGQINGKLKQNQEIKENVKEERTRIYTLKRLTLEANCNP